MIMIELRNRFTKSTFFHKTSDHLYRTVTILIGYYSIHITFFSSITYLGFSLPVV